MSGDYKEWQTTLASLRRRRGAAAAGLVAKVDRRPAKVAIVLATAHGIATAISDARGGSGAEVARALHRSRNRISQLRALASLAPDIQEEILHLDAVDRVEPVTEKWVFENVARSIDWDEQRAAWRRRKHVGH